MRSPNNAARDTTSSRRVRGLAILVALVLASCGAACVLALFWQGLAEAVEPHWTLQLYGLFSRSKDGVEVAVGPDSSVLLYGEARPHVGQIAALQKGLVWEYDGQFLIEEGHGFGAPIIVAQGQRYHARNASIYFDPTATEFRLRKVFVMDTVETPMRLLRRRYRPSEPIGEVAVTYVVRSGGIIDVEVDCSGLTVPWEQALIMNEQGARHFTRYADDSGLLLRGREIGPWQQTTASTACLQSVADEVQFCVTSEAGGSLFYGRERRLQWNWRGAAGLSSSGVNIVLDGPQDIYRYRIELGAASAPVGEMLD